MADCPTKSTDSYKYYYTKRIGKTDAWFLVPHANVEMSEILGERFRDVYFPTPNLEGILAKLNDKVVGFLSFEEHDGGYWTNLTYVVPEHRRKGIHTAMFEKLKARAESEKKSKIVSSSDIGNEASNKSQLSQGRVPTSYNYVYLIGENEIELK